MATPRWFDALNKALSHPDNKGKIIYQVATVDANNLPRVRSQVHRGFMNPDGHPELPILVTSTDARTPKVTQMHTNQRVELAWWMEGSQDQFRLTGFTYVLPSPALGTPSHPTSIPAEAVALNTLDAQNFDWEAKRKEVFDKMNPGMRAWWAAPQGSGTPIASYELQKEWPKAVSSSEDAKSDEDKRNLETALTNFALMLVEPVEVDWVALGVQPNKRTVFRRHGAKWVEQLLAP